MSKLNYWFSSRNRSINSLITKRKTVNYTCNNVIKKEIQKTFRSNTADFTDSGVKTQIKNYDFVSSNRSNEEQSYIKFQDFTER